MKMMFYHNLSITYLLSTLYLVGRFALQPNVMVVSEVATEDTISKPRWNLIWILCIVCSCYPHLIDKSNKLCESTRCMCIWIWICIFISNVMLYEMIRNANLLASFQCLAWYIRGPWINWMQFTISYFYLSVWVFFFAYKSSWGFCL